MERAAAATKFLILLIRSPRTLKSVLRRRRARPLLNNLARAVERAAAAAEFAEQKAADRAARAEAARRAEATAYGKRAAAAKAGARISAAGAKETLNPRY